MLVLRSAIQRRRRPRLRRARGRIDFAARTAEVVAPRVAAVDIRALVHRTDVWRQRGTRTTLI